MQPTLVDVCPAIPPALVYTDVPPVTAGLPPVTPSSQLAADVPPVLGCPPTLSEAPPISTVELDVPPVANLGSELVTCPEQPTKELTASNENHERSCDVLMTEYPQSVPNRWQQKATQMACRTPKCLRIECLTHGIDDSTAVWHTAA